MNYYKLEVKLIKLIASALKKYQVVECYSGLDSGAGLIWALSLSSAALHFGKDRVKFIAEVPCIEQNKDWRWNFKRLYEILYKRADRVNRYSLKYEPIDSEVYITRNKHMIDNSDMAIFIWQPNIMSMGSPISIAYDYAKSNKKQILHIAPNDLQFQKDK